jgi:hypothetical protein
MVEDKDRKPCMMKNRPVTTTARPKLCKSGCSTVQCSAVAIQGGGAAGNGGANHSLALSRQRVTRRLFTKIIFAQPQGRAKNSLCHMPVVVVVVVVVVVC